MFALATISTMTEVSSCLQKEQSPPRLALQNSNSRCLVLTETILDILESFSKHFGSEATHGEHGNQKWIGRMMFFDVVFKQVVRNQAIKMILPSFPWKSINTVDKVIGKLPDLGEVLALARLDDICRTICSVYTPGAEIIIATDGLVFDDIVGIPDEDTWEYSEALMDIVARKGFHSIKIRRVMDILDLSKTDKLTKESYMKLAQDCRVKLLQSYAQTEDEVRNMMKSDTDTLMTYCGFIRFLEKDLRYSPIAKTTSSGSKYRKEIKKVALGMMIRAESFTKLLRDRCSDFVRLSIHPSSGAVKLSIPLIVQENDEFPRTPWHCTIAVGVDGSYRTIHTRDVQETHNLICLDGVPSYYREKSCLWDWDNEHGVVFEPQYPRGMIIRPAQSNNEEAMIDLQDHQILKLRELAALFRGPIKVKGFANS